MATQQLLRHCANHIIFRTLHYAFIALQLRDELAKSSPGGRSCSTQCRPFVLWLTHMLVSYAGDIVVNLLLGTLPLEPLSNMQDIVLCTTAWYLIFYSPCDWAHSLARTLTFRIVATTVVALNQVVHIERGVRMASRIYGHNAMVPILIVGTVIGSGAEFLKPVAALLINRCQLNNAASVKLSTDSKLALGIAWLNLLQLNRSQLLCGLARHQLQFYALLTLMTFKYLALFYRMELLVFRLEHRLCYAFFGGLYADLEKLFARRRMTFTKLT